MVFSSTIFLFLFLPITLLVNYAIKEKLSNYWLLIVSVVFFSWTQWNYLWIILCSVCVNYVCAMVVDYLKRRNADRFRGFIMFVAVAVNLGILFYFKYFNFVMESVNSVFHTGFDIEKIILPVGISFFTFQGMSYVIDVYRGDVPVQKNVFKLALYIVLFPQLIAGPIVRYTDIAAEIEQRKVSFDDLVCGIERFIIGLAKKAIIANTMGELCDRIWDAGAGNGLASELWLGSIAYTLQIFFDFSGYSDMAIGIGRMLGFHFNENFSLPYISKSITEFWRRWHISLSTWFRDYVYIPLGGNRKRVYLNLSVVFLLTGIWHGAAWNFVLWGVWNGVFIVVERLIGKRCGKKEFPKAAQIMGKVYTLFIVNMGWVLFRAPGISAAIDYAKGMFGITHADKPGYALSWYMTRWNVFILILGVLFASSIPEKIRERVKAVLSANVYTVVKYASLLLLLMFSAVRIVAGTYNPFIYFQF